MEQVKQQLIEKILKEENNEISTEQPIGKIVKAKNVQSKDISLYYSPDKLLSYNRMLSFCIGGRSIGKTYSMKSYAVRQFLKHGKMFGYIRRYKEELKGMETFFDAIQKDFLDVEFEVKGRKFYINGKLAGLAFQLSQWQSYKSKEYPLIDFMMFDEFIREKDNSGYIPNEVEGLLNLLHTVFRDRPNTRCVCLSNAVSVINPYFIFFGLTPDITKRFNAYPQLVVEIPPSKEFANEFRKSRFGQLIDGTTYGDMALDNEFTGDDYTFVEKRSKGSKYVFSVVYKGLIMGVWIDTRLELMFLSQDHDPSSKDVYAIVKEDMTENRKLVRAWKDNYHLMKLGKVFKNGNLRFDNQVVRTTGYDMFKKMGVQ
jgi:hypothetical protein